MDKNIIKIDDAEIEKYKIYWHKSPASTNNMYVYICIYMYIYIYIYIIVVSNKVSFGKNDFITILLVIKMLKN